jgi:hypothetical protein
MSGNRRTVEPSPTNGSVHRREQRGEVEPVRLREERTEATMCVSELALRPARVAGELLLAGGGEMDERSRELAFVGARRGVHGPAEVRDGL